MKKADEVQILKYVLHNVAASYGKTVTFMPKPLVGDNGSGMHVHQSLSKDGKNIVLRRQVRADCPKPCLYYIGGIIKHAKARQRLTNADDQQLQAPGARLRSPGDAGLLGPQPLRLDPRAVGVEPEGATHRGAIPGFDAPIRILPSPR